MGRGRRLNGPPVRGRSVRGDAMVMAALDPTPLPVSRSHPVATDRTGVMLEGKYRLVRRLGEGGMGVVYEAHHAIIDRRCAVVVEATIAGATGEVSGVRVTGARPEDDRCIAPIIKGLRFPKFGRSSLTVNYRYTF